MLILKQRAILINAKTVMFFVIINAFYKIYYIAINV